MIKEYKIPKLIDEYYEKPENRIILQKKFKNAFVDTKRLKFPIINPFTGKIYCPLCIRSLSRALIWTKKEAVFLKIDKQYYLNIVKQLNNIINQNCKKNVKAK